MRNKHLAAGLVAAAALMAAACGSATSSTGAGSTPAGTSSSGTALKTAMISGTAVLTNATGFTLYWFAPDTATKSACNGGCAQVWTPVKGPVTAGGVSGKFGTITRTDGSVQATYNGHPLYTYTADTAPGQANGNGINASGGVWHEMTASGTPAPASTHSAGGGYGY